MSTIDRRGVIVGDALPPLGSTDPSANIAIKTPVRVVATANITLNGLQAIDGVTVAELDRVLVAGQTDTTQNGIYLASSGNWTRTTDLDAINEAVTGTVVFVNEGMVAALSAWIITSSDPVIPDSALTFSVYAPPLSVGAQSILAGTNGDILYNNAGVLGNLPVTGTAGNVVLSGSPTVVTPTFSFAVGSTSTITATSANTGFANILQAINSGTNSNAGTSAQVEAQIAGSSTFVTMVAQGGTSLQGQLIGGVGMVGGLLILPRAGSLTLGTGSTVRQTIQNGGNIGFGTETNPQGSFVISQNVTTGLSTLSGTALQLVAVDGNSTQLLLDTYENSTAANSGTLMSRTARGTAASPANLQSGDNILQISARPYTNGAFVSQSPAQIVFSYADTSPNTGTNIQFIATPSGSTTRAQAMRVQAGVRIGTGTSDPGSTNLIVEGTFNSGAGGAFGVDASGNLVTSGILKTTASTVASSTTTGSGIFAGGVGIAGALFAGGATNLASALTYGGVTLSNAVTGTGNMVLSAAPTFTGTATIATLAATTINGFTLGGTVAGGGNQINNIVIGNSTPLAGSFTTVSGSTSVLSSGATGGIGYATGAGGAVTQLSSRTTGVTLNKVCGAITLFAAAPAVGTWVSFTVTNSAVASTDVPKVAVKSGTNTYIAHVTAVAAGSFQISITSIVGTSSDSPVINFAIDKAVTS